MITDFQGKKQGSDLGPAANIANFTGKQGISGNAENAEKIVWMNTGEQKTNTNTVSRH